MQPRPLSLAALRYADGGPRFVLYKYCPPERVDILDKGLIGLPKPRFFNDPFELSPNVSTIEMSRVAIEHT
jgi:hypothetical protein